MAEDNTSFDARITPCRGDIAAAGLEGTVSADRFVEGRAMQVTAPVAPLREVPDANSPVGRRETQLLYGEAFTVYDEANGWAWGQAQADDYVGYVETRHLGTDITPATHRINTLAAHIYAQADAKSPTANLLSFATPLALSGESRNGFAELVQGGWIFEGHVSAQADVAADFAATARLFLGVPYLFAGRSCFGIDCSALVQLALLAACIKAPRDSDMQLALGEAVAHPGDEPPLDLQRGDLVFFPGHIGIMEDAEHIIHANMKQMKVSIDPVFGVAGYYRQKDGKGVTAVRRLI